MSPFRRIGSGQDGFGGQGWNLHWIVSHGKNGSPTTLPKQAGNLPQHKAHDDGIFLRFRVIISAPGNGFETTLFVEHLRGLICAADL